MHVNATPSHPSTFIDNTFQYFTDIDSAHTQNEHTVDTGVPGTTSIVGDNGGLLVTPHTAKEQNSTPA